MSYLQNIETSKKEIFEIGVKSILDDYFLYFENENYTEYPDDKIHFNEITSDTVKKLFLCYIQCATLDDAEEYLDEFANTLTENTHSQINRELPNYKETPEYIQWCKYCDIRSRIRRIGTKLKFPSKWVQYNGEKRTFDEACELAATKWMELIFKWHLNDNGALNEEHSFLASALSSYIGNSIKDKISEETKQKAFNLFIDFYKAFEFYDRKWLIKNIPSDNPEKFNWEHFPALSCDYGPSISLYLILFNAGIPEKDIECICPWKTTIYIRTDDNAVILRNSQKLTSF